MKIYIRSASIDEMEKDYVESFINYFHLENDPELCEVIGNRMVGGMLEQIGDAREYLISCGMEEIDIDLLSRKLEGMN